MAQIAFDAIPESAANGGSTNDVNFFNLKNNGDEAIVRIIHDSVETFNIFACHEAQVGGKRRKINCIRDPKDATDNCPLCASGVNTTYRIFINMLQYTMNEQGQIVAKPVVWERSLAYATKLKSLIEEYGPLSECLFKIKRNGAAGSMDTTYDIFYCSPKVYPDTSYPASEAEKFKTYSALGTIIMNKNFNELSTFVATGSFPATQSTADVNAPEALTMPAPAATAYVPKAAPQQYSQMSPVEAVPVAQPLPYAEAAPAVAPLPVTPVQADAPSWQPQTVPAAPGVGAPTPGRPARYY